MGQGAADCERDQDDVARRGWLPVGVLLVRGGKRPKRPSMEELASDVPS